MSVLRAAIPASSTFVSGLFEKVIKVKGQITNRQKHEDVKTSRVKPSAWTAFLK